MGRQFYTYLHCKPDGIPFYVGKGTGRRSHNFIAGRSLHHRNIVAKYGAENILIFIFSCPSEDQAFKDEIHQISQLRKEGFNLINLTDGGDGPSGAIRSKESIEKAANAKRGKKHSDEHRAKISASLLGNKRNVGKKHSVETIAKMSAAKIGKKKSEITKKKMSGAQQNRPLEIRAKISEALKGHTVSEETRQKIRNSLLKRNGA